VSREDEPSNVVAGEKLVKALRDLGVRAHITDCFVGPHVTRWELALAGGSALRKVRSLAEELAYALAATEIRVIAPIPGKQAIGIEIPNATRSLVCLKDIATVRPAGQSPLSVWLGRDVTGGAINVDLAAMPHVLVAGTTGAGKSGGLHAMISSILMGASPDEARLVLIDTKRVEFNRYEHVQHLLRPVVFDEFDAVSALADLVGIMEDRYKQMGRAQTRGLGELNAARIKEGESPLPHILCVVDEFADLMALSAGEVQEMVVRLAQKARAVGIHLVLATQTPRVTVITGVIKANIPARIAFAVASKLDSRVILDMNGAESLLGAGDLLFKGLGSSHPLRIQGSYIEGDEIDALTRPLRQEPLEEALCPEDYVDDDPRDDAAVSPQEPPRVPDTPVEAAEVEPDLGSTLDDDLGSRDLVAGEVVGGRQRVGRAEEPAQTVAVATELGEPVRALLERTSVELSDALEGWEALADSAVALLVGRYTAALLSSIEQGARDPALLDRFERLLGILI
jgi:S-DNA-T family DNA segregation ATPase FtsK/SpoIIIE